LSAKIREKIRECIARLSTAVSRGELSEVFRGFEEDLCEGAVRGLDIDQFRSYDEWVRWLSWSSVVLDENDYLKAALHALRLAPKIAATDYGTARQRDLGQLWTDAIRGFLGEVAFAKWLNERFGVSAELDYRRGSLQEFLPSDVKKINGRDPRLKISIKTTKLGGIWLDIPGAQIDHSDVFVLVRVGTAREHFVAFLKKISVIRDKLMKEAVGRGLLRAEELSEIWNAVPDFTSVPACIAGFFNKLEVAEKIKSRLSIIEADAEVKIKKAVVNKFLGFWHPGREEYEKALREMLKSRGRSIKDDMKIEFKGIRDFTETLHFVASSGVLKKRKEDWEELIQKL